MIPIEPSVVIELLLLGGGLGFAGGVFGIGGGIVAIPVLTLAWGLDQATAQGTALVMMVPNLLIAWWRYVRHNPVPLRDALGVAATGAVTTAATSQLAHWLDQELLRALFALFLLFLAMRMALGARKGAAPSPALHRRLLPLVGTAGGASMGLLGIGGGLVSAPLFARLFALDQRVAQSLGLALVTPSSVVALGAYAGHGRVDWLIGICLALGGALTVAAGVALAHRLPERRLQVLFAVMLGLTSLWILVGRWLIA